MEDSLQRLKVNKTQVNTGYCGRLPLQINADVDAGSLKGHPFLVKPGETYALDDLGEMAWTFAMGAEDYGYIRADSAIGREVEVPSEYSWGDDEIAEKYHAPRYASMTTKALSDDVDSVLLPECDEPDTEWVRRR